MSLETVTGEQESVAVGCAQVTTAPQSPAVFVTEMFAGTPERVGAAPSSTVTVKEAVLVFPPASVAVYVTTVTPRGKLAPLAWLDERLAAPQLSVAVGAVQVEAAVQLVPVVETVRFAGIPAITGSSSSVTVKLKLACEEFPAASVAV
jgi:hypothetical protein